MINAGTTLLRSLTTEDFEWQQQHVRIVDTGQDVKMTSTIVIMLIANGSAEKQTP